MFSTVCTRYIHVALAAYVPMLWERFTFGHSCNYSVVLSKNVSTWNKKKHLVIFLYIFPEKKKRSLVLVSYSWKPFSHELLWKNTRLQITLPGRTRTVIARIDRYNIIIAWKETVLSPFSFFALRFHKEKEEKTSDGWFSEDEPLDLSFWHVCSSLNLINKTGSTDPECTAQNTPQCRFLLFHDERAECPLTPA